MIQKSDVDNSGKLEFSEFLKLYAEKIKEPIGDEDIAKYFALMDRNGNGMIDS
eukprot:CAMPEP_0168315736 /NCGR_PEP_ID=MMETSP0210-20121227/12538_1 /TAXON_ID=40633 /ORGANISM="Condylostoma magnum, Strain COL2" /LENGTH=52 /DNA_ID=CAMNT_0008291189 /DNA_START=149 /DNA_END=307 /DNA_ORIENTATION=-